MIACSSGGLTAGRLDCPAAHWPTAYRRIGHELAVLATPTLEAILRARVRRDLTPLDLVHRQLRNLLLAERPKGADDDQL